MEAGEIYRKTMPFCMAKLTLGALAVAISAALLAVLMGLGWLFGSSGVTGILLLVWLAATGVVRFLLMQYVGYLVKAGHIAVIAEAVVTGHIPDDQVAYGKKIVTERFATSNVYFAVDKLVAGAVKQLQGYLQSAGNALDFIPGIDSLMKVGKLFIDISVGYIDECCLGYSFYKRDQGAFKSAADGVVIYAENWKKLLSDAAKTTALVVGLLVAVTLVAFIVLGLLCKLFGLPGYLGFLVACLIALAVKFAFIDSYILVKMMVSFMEVAPTTVLKVDLYDTLCAASSKFQELYEKGKNEIFGPKPADTTTTPASS
ncbi:MAG: hypothetical protein FWD79_06885 [Desulfobulbus sp.]|nr:hypothetical protein [Desulfobulbus sp.]